MSSCQSQAYIQFGQIPSVRFLQLTPVGLHPVQVESASKMATLALVWHHVAKLLMVLVILASLAAAVPLASAVSLDKRMYPGTSGGGAGQQITWDQLDNGHFAPDNTMRSTHPSRLTAAYRGSYFHEGTPILRFPLQHGSIHQSGLQQALKDFGSFHAHDDATKRVVTVTRHPSDPSKVIVHSQGRPDVIDTVQHGDYTKAIFGDHVADVVHGRGVNPAPVPGVLSVCGMFLNLQRGTRFKRLGRRGGNPLLKLSGSNSIQSAT